MSPLRTAHGWEEAKKALLPKTCHIISSIDETRHSYTLPKEDQKYIYIYISQRHLLSFVDMSFFLPKINNFCYI